MVEKDGFFIGVYDPLDVRRNTLECSKEIINSIQKSETLEQIRKEKLKTYGQMKSVMEELTLLVNKLRTRLPVSHLRKAISHKKTRSSPVKINTEFSSELKKLEKQLKEVEDELISLD